MHRQEPTGSSEIKGKIGIGLVRIRVRVKKVLEFLQDLKFE